MAVFAGRCLSQRRSEPKLREKTLDSVRADIKIIGEYLDSFNNKVLDTLIKRFYSCRKTDYNDEGEDTTFSNLMKDEIPEFIKFKNKIINEFYPKEHEDSTYFFYYGNFELKNYIYSLDLLKVEMKNVLTFDNTINSINSNNFMTSYNYMNQCRTALFTRMNSIEERMLIDTLGYRTSKIDRRVMSMDSLLRSPYLPLVKHKKDWAPPLYLRRDKISSATDFTYFNTRRRIRTWGIIDGALVVIATALILGTRNHH